MFCTYIYALIQLFWLFGKEESHTIKNATVLVKKTLNNTLCYMAGLCIKAIITSCAVPSFIYAFDRDDDENGQRCGAMCKTQHFLWLYW